MKGKIIFFFILVVFFVVGILIYDFSDKMDDILLNNKWYLYENDITYIMDFNNNEFEYTLEDGTRIDKYNTCHTFAYNSSSSIVKLNCNINDNKIYIAKYDKDSLTVTIDGALKKLFSNKELALVNNFKESNNLSDEEYNSLLAIKFDEGKYIDYSNFKKLIKDKNNSYVALVRNEINYDNALNYKALEKILDDNFYLVNLDSISEKDLKNINSKTKIDKYDSNIIYVYMLGDKKISLVKEINLENIKEINSFKI